LTISHLSNGTSWLYKKTLFRHNDGHCSVDYYVIKMSVDKMFFDGKTWRESFTLRIFIKKIVTSVPSAFLQEWMKLEFFSFSTKLSSSVRLHPSTDFSRFFWIFPDFFRIFLDFSDFSRFFWIFLNFSEFFWIFLNFSEFFWIFLDFYGFFWIFPDFSRFFQIFPDFSRFFWIFLDFSRFFQIFSDFSSFFQIFPEIIIFLNKIKKSIFS
jgi:hypothetical protein